MKPFLDENFLLETKTSEVLYHEYASKMPIIDYHNHLPPDEIANNKQFESITKLWLGGDHYKWRAMRTFGIEEKYVTGDASDSEKFEKWADLIPYTLRNPIYHWTHLELQRYFNINKQLSPATAKEVYNECNRLLQTSEFKVQPLLQKANVEVLCTTDDPIDSLEHHKAIGNNLSFRVYPTWRPDKAMNAENTVAFNVYLNKLSEVSGVEISSYGKLIEALEKRHDYFAQHGCRLSDHGLEEFFAEDYTLQEIETIFAKARNNKPLTSAELAKYKSAMLVDFAAMDARTGWAQQFHYGVLRNNNSRLFKKLGPDTGFDSIGDFTVGRNMQRFLNRLDEEGQLTKTILYNINPAENELIATMIGNFNDGSIRGKMQFGSAWWFLDQKDGMEKQIHTLSALGLLSCFVGMLTDSRSFVSFPRHEYFRRILCNILGNDIEKGMLPNDTVFIGKVVQDICYNNAKKYFGF
jgi:glucuronate isomerase